MVLPSSKPGQVTPMRSIARPETPMTLAFTVVKPTVADDSAAIAAWAQVMLDTARGRKQLTIQGHGNATILQLANDKTLCATLGTASKTVAPNSSRATAHLYCWCQMTRCWWQLRSHHRWLEGLALCSSQWQRCITLSSIITCTTRLTCLQW